ncbi:hypothetical protein BpHYR1_016540 [Brachionus plicatilis]|uniref:Uncharacterized protein n=1 Tax=Brachionus plicatilis TaxID=10195 RepID=A0A3M7PS39_BRAPC|nr:hypothetical protein BpHYR1_016540 [Brachionus plicatilis]
MCQLEISVENKVKGKRGRGCPSKRKVEDEVVDLNKPAKKKPGRPSGDLIPRKVGKLSGFYENLRIC